MDTFEILWYMGGLEWFEAIIESFVYLYTQMDALMKLEIHFDYEELHDFMEGRTVHVVLPQTIFCD